MVISVLFLVLATGLSVAVIQSVIDSAKTDVATIIMFDRVLLEPGLPAGIWILCGMSAAAALAWVAAVAHIRGLRLERRMAAELDARYQELSSSATGDAARAHLLEARVAELQTWYERSTRERDEALMQLEEVQEELHRLQVEASRASVVAIPEASETQRAAGSPSGL